MLGILRDLGQRGLVTASSSSTSTTSSTRSRTKRDVSGVLMPERTAHAPVTFPRPAPFISIAPHGQFASATRGSIFRVNRSPNVADRHRRGDPAGRPVVRPLRERDGDRPGESGDRDASSQVTQQARVTSTDGARSHLRLGPHPTRRHRQPDTTPYIVGGTLFLGLGAGFVVVFGTPGTPGLLNPLDDSFDPTFIVRS